jgi:hypothetical protein
MGGASWEGLGKKLLNGWFSFLLFNLRHYNLLLLEGFVVYDIRALRVAVKSDRLKVELCTLGFRLAVHNLYIWAEDSWFYRSASVITYAFQKNPAQTIT